jgi:hypothetical protein
MLNLPKEVFDVIFDFCYKQAIPIPNTDEGLLSILGRMSAIGMLNQKDLNEIISEISDKNC